MDLISDVTENEEKKDQDKNNQDKKEEELEVDLSSTSLSIKQLLSVSKEELLNNECMIIQRFGFIRPESKEFDNLYHQVQKISTLKLFQNKQKIHGFQQFKIVVAAIVATVA